MTEVKIYPIQPDRIVIVLEKGYQLSPYFEDVLKRIRNSGRSESFTVIRIGNILHCVFPDA